jgi:hypothetical protein
MPRVVGLGFEIALNAESAIAMISQAVLASAVGAALLGLVSAERFPGMNFAARFFYVLWRYTIPAFIFSGSIYWLVWRGATP